MGYWGKLEEKNTAIKLRKEGFSYGEILKHVTVSKGTLSVWCKNIDLTVKQKIRLQNKKTDGQHKGSIVAAENKKRLRVDRTKSIFNIAKKEVGNLSKRDRFLTGIALYAGEGYKTDNSVGFANANPVFIKFMMDWFREFCDIPESKFRGAIWINDNLDSFKAKKYWSELTGIPENQFHKTYIAIDKKESKKIRKNVHSYGVFSIRFSGSDKQRKILGWISALLGGKIQAYVDIPL